MTEQERFERLVSSDPFGYVLDKTPFGYKLFAVNELRAMWIAGRTDAYGEIQESFKRGMNSYADPSVK